MKPLCSNFYLSLLLPLLLLSILPHGSSLKTLFHPRDLLPLLPRQLSRPILNSLGSAVDILPTFVASASYQNNSLPWKGACFYETSAWMEFNNKSGTEFGGGTLHIKTDKAHSWTCMDLYIFATPYRVTWDYYFLGREHTLEFKEWEGKEEYEYVKNRGVSIFLMHSGMLGTLRALWDVFPLFTNTGWGEDSNLAFLKKHMDANFEERPQPWVTNITIDDVHSGDFIALSKVRGRWGGFETLEKWVTGAYAGHTAVLLKDPEGKLWVGESGHENKEVCQFLFELFGIFFLSLQTLTFFLKGKQGFTDDPLPLLHNPATHPSPGAREFDMTRFANLKVIHQESYHYGHLHI